MKIMVIPDIHGRHEKLQTALDRFEEKSYDKVVLLGDLADSYDRSNEDILRCFKIAFDAKEKYGDRMAWLLGNHELHYMYASERCSGFRPDLAVSLNPWLVENRKLLKVAHQEGLHLFTHAGVQKLWYKKHRDLTIKYEDEGRRLGDTLNNMMETREGFDALTEVGVPSGGLRGDYGGPFWARRVEMESYGPLAGYHQYVGHTPQKYRERVEKFEGGKRYNNTSVTFCDIIEREEKFWTKVEI